MRRLLFLALLISAWTTAGAQEGFYEDPLPLGGWTLSEDEVEAFIFDSDAESVVGVWTWADGIAAEFGTDSDWEVFYNGSDNNQLIFTTPNTSAGTVINAMFLVNADNQTEDGTNLTADQILFEVSKGSFDAFSVPFPLFIVDAEGDTAVRGDLIIGGFIASSTMSGDLIFPDNINAAFGTASDATISYDTTNLLINPQAVGTGHTDFTDAIFVAEDEDVFSRFGGQPTHLSPGDVKDKLVVRLERTATNQIRRALTAVTDINHTGNSAAQNYGLNVFVYTDEANDSSLTKATFMGGAVAGRYGIRHQGSGLLARVGGVSSFVEITGDDKDGDITEAYAFLDEGGTGGTGGSIMADYYGLWILDSGNNITTKTGIYIEDLSSANTNIGIRIDGVAGVAGDHALWIGAGEVVTDAANGIAFGSGADVNLYRSATDTLKTDDTFDIVKALVIGEGLTVDVETITGTSATMGADDYIFLVDDDTAGSTVTITLPAVASHVGRTYHIKKLGTTANVVIDGNSAETIDGGATATLTFQYESIKIVATASGWHIL
jgi:hypothetical protein